MFQKYWNDISRVNVVIISSTADDAICNEIGLGFNIVTAKSMKTHLADLLDAYHNRALPALKAAIDYEVNVLGLPRRSMQVTKKELAELACKTCCTSFEGYSNLQHVAEWVKSPRLLDLLFKEAKEKTSAEWHVRMSTMYFKGPNYDTISKSDSEDLKVALAFIYYTDSNSLFTLALSSNGT